MRSTVFLLALIGFVRGENLALKKPTIQSSTYYFGTASKAVDGNVGNDYNGQKSCTHTQHDQSRAFWAVDLGGKMKVGSVEITNRGDCCSDRLRNFEIIVSNTKPSGRSHVYKDAEICHRQSNSFEGTKSFSCEKALVGRWVVVRFYDNGKRPLTLCEVKVEGVEANGIFCHRAQSDCYHHDVAVIKDSSLEKCQKACYERDDCMSIQYNDKRECFIKNYACIDKELVPNPIANDFILVENEDQCPIAFEYCHRAGVDCKGHDLKHYKGLNLAQCKMRCSVTRDCRSVQYYKNVCYLKSFACADFEVMGISGGHDYIRVYGQSQCKYLWQIYD